MGDPELEPCDDFDIDAPSFNAHYDEILAALPTRCPVVRSRVGDGYWLVSRYADVRAACEDWETFSSARGFMPNRPDDVPYLYPVECDPPYHDAWRAVLDPYFSPEAVAGHEGAIRADARSLIAGFAERDGCELRADFAARLPGHTLFRHVIPLPVEVLPEMLDNLEQGIFGPRTERTRAWQRSFTYLGDYLSRRCASSPRGDVVDAIVAGVDRDGAPCAFADKVSVIVDLVQGGVATCTNVIIGAVHHLAAHPADQARLRARPELIPNAVEEFLRACCPVVALGRSVTADTELGGCRLGAGDFVMLGFAPAARDPAFVADPAVVDIERDPVEHTAFGFGTHRCIGEHLARAQVRIALEELLTGVPSFALPEDFAPRYETGVLRTMVALPLRFAP